uniref:Uncharacterized protein n=1 Tax=Arundo donax TaxID=35708 RepID=A0A0A9CJB7_ARUDO
MAIFLVLLALTTHIQIVESVTTSELFLQTRMLIICPLTSSVDCISRISN